MSESQWPTPDQVIAALEASGHLLEQQVGTEIAQHGYHVRTNYAFKDADEGKSRELDVWAYKEFHRDDERRIRVGIYLLIECKKTAAPFAFLTRPLPPRHRPPEEVQITHHSVTEQYSEGGKTYHRRTPMFSELGLDKVYWGTADPVKAVHVSRLDRKSGTWQANNTGVFDSLTWPLAKALRATKAPFRNQNRAFAGTDWSQVLLFLPMVVVASRLFTVDGTAPEPTAIEVSHVRLQRELQAELLEGVFPIDFVQRDGLGDFIVSKVDTFGETMASAVLEDPARVVPGEGWPMWTDW